MRIVLGFLVLLTLFGGVDVEAGKKKQKNRTPRVVIVRDYTTGAWEGVVEAVVEDFNAVMPEGGPTLRYVGMGAAPCPGWRKHLKPRKRGKRINICDVAEMPCANCAGVVSCVGRILLTTDLAYGHASVVCHEMMHALTGIPDNYGARDDSCVWGWLAQPGSFDVEVLRKAFTRRR